MYMNGPKERAKTDATRAPSLTKFNKSKSLIEGATNILFVLTEVVFLLAGDLGSLCLKQ